MTTRNWMKRARCRQCDAEFDEAQRAWDTVADTNRCPECGAADSIVYTLVDPRPPSLDERLLDLESSTRRPAIRVRVAAWIASADRISIALGAAILLVLLLLPLPVVEDGVLLTRALVALMLMSFGCLIYAYHKAFPSLLSSPFALFSHPTRSEALSEYVDGMRDLSDSAWGMAIGLGPLSVYVAALRPDLGPRVAETATWFAIVAALYTAFAILARRTRCHIVNAFVALSSACLLVVSLVIMTSHVITSDVLWIAIAPVVLQLYFLRLSSRNLRLWRQLRLNSE